MSWSTPFVIYRVSSEGKLEEVFRAEDIKKAKYWLTYIAQVGDVLCRTPMHPKHAKATSSPEYHGHKEQSGKAAADEAQWKALADQRGWNSTFPETETTQAGAEN